MKALKLGIAVVTIIMLASCAGTSFPLPGYLYAQEFGPITRDQGGQIVHGTKVQGKSCATSILSLIATGDASILAAEQNALSNVPGATKLTNVTVDYDSMNILGLYAHFCTIVTGVPVK